MMDGETKVCFRIDQDEDGFPPVAVESVWARPCVGARCYVLDNIPFFTRQATLGDAVIALPDALGVLWFECIDQRSSNSLVRAVFLDGEHRDLVISQLEELGCSTERMDEFNLLAINVPGSIRLNAVQRLLQAQAASGWIDYEEPILRQ